MELLILALIILIVVGLALYAIDLAPLDGRFRTALKIIIVLIAVLLLIERAGLL